MTAYPRRENDYTRERTAHLADLRQSIFDEIKARTRETDLGPHPQPRALVLRAFLRGQGVRRQLPRAGRRPRRLDPAPPAEDTAPTSRPSPARRCSSTSTRSPRDTSSSVWAAPRSAPTGDLLAYSTDVVGDERYTIHVKDLATGELRADEITGVLGGATWARDGQSFFYTTVDDTWRADKIWQHRLGTAQSDDALVHHETDGRFWVAWAGPAATASSWSRAAEDHLGVPLPRRRRTRARPPGLQRAPRGAGVLPRPRGHRRHRHLPRAPQRHRPGLRARHLARATHPPEQWRPLIAHDPAVRLEGRGRLRRPPRRAPAQRGPGPAADRGAVGVGPRRGLPRRVRPRDLHGRVGRQPGFHQPVVRLGYTTMAVPRRSTTTTCGPAS